MAGAPGANVMMKDVVAPAASLNGVCGPEEIRNPEPLTPNVEIVISCVPGFRRLKLHKCICPTCTRPKSIEGGGPSEPVHAGNTVNSAPVTTATTTVTVMLFRLLASCRFAL